MDPSSMVGGQLPQLRGESLSRQPYDFPSDLTADATLLIVAFQQWQQRDVNTWLPTAAELAGVHPTFAYFEVPLINRRYRPAKAFIDGGMRSGITDPQVRATTVTAYQSVPEFLRALGLADNSKIVTLLVDSEGIIRWSSLGPLTDPGIRSELRRNIAALVEPGS